MKKTTEKNRMSHRKEFLNWLYGEMEKFTKDLNHYNEECDYYRATKAESKRDALLSVLKKLQGNE